MPINRLVFLDIITFDDGKALRAAALLTNPETVPLEFHLTDAIRPTPAQRLLYGKIFERHLRVEVFGKPLLEALAEKPEIVILKEIEFCRHLAKAIDLPVVLISPSKEIQGSDISDSDSRAAILGHLKEISLTEDLLEPFERIENVVTQVHKKQLANQTTNHGHTTRP